MLFMALAIIQQNADLFILCLPRSSQNGTSMRAGMGMLCPLLYAQCLEEDPAQNEFSTDIS